MKRIDKQTKVQENEKPMDEVENFMRLTKAQNIALKKMIDRLQLINNSSQNHNAVTKDKNDSKDFSTK